ncbi:MAG: Uma2 family endonuclease [Leptolyngbyaceae cyanobacterium MO_188.B28]|nr:Uma2 family endonuclease [Leptolyngbyaceae cyanobacterium MO_188.B28]
MQVVVSPDQVQMSPGTIVRLLGSWRDYQTLAQQRGDTSIPRLKYRRGEILLMSPLPVHGRDANIIADIVKALLDHLDQDYEAFTPVTLELPEEGGIEPDYCFYINNWEAAAGKQRINWQTDPPPDLVIEVDVTSFTQVEDYLPYRIPEVWLLKQQALHIYELQEGTYIAKSNSRYFPGMDVMDLTVRCFEAAYARNTGAAIRELRKWLT